MTTTLDRPAALPADFGRTDYNPRCIWMSYEEAAQRSGLEGVWWAGRRQKIIQEVDTIHQQLTQRDPQTGWYLVYNTQHRLEAPPGVDPITINIILAELHNRLGVGDWVPRLQSFWLRPIPVPDCTGKHSCPACNGSWCIKRR